MRQLRHAALALLVGLAATVLPTDVARAQTATYVDPTGREWMRLDETFAFAGSVPSMCSPACSGVVTKYDYNVRTNAFTNPQLISLDGWVWANNAEVQGLMDTTQIVSLGISQMFVTTYSYSASVHAVTSTLGAASGQYYVGHGYEGHAMVTFDFGQAIVLPSAATPFSGPGGAFLYRVPGYRGITATDDVGQVVSPAGGVAVANVLVNDFVDGQPATLASATLSATPSGALSLNPATGQVAVAAGASPGVHNLTYRACTVATPELCDTAVVTVTVPPYPIDARNDAGTASPSSGGVAVPNVLDNDVLGTGRATLANVALSLVGSTSAGVTLDLADGSVDVARGTPLGSYSLNYRICERANPTNCDAASVGVTVAPKVVYAGDDSARASSKVANTAIASVFANDTLGGVPASASTVRLSLVTAPPRYVVLNTTTGAVRVTRKTDSGTFQFTYRICERADLTNCDDAVVTLDLTGSGG